MVIAFGHSVCIGNHMILSAIWNKIMNTSKFFKDHGLVQFGVFETFTSTYLFQIAREKSCDYLLLTKKKKCSHNESGKNWAIQAALDFEGKLFDWS